jgi:hypothetical protein
MMRTFRLTAVSRRLGIAWIIAGSALLLLIVHVFFPRPELQWAALGLVGVALVVVWTAILCWRMPVFSPTTLWLFTLTWCVGLALSITLVLISSGLQHPMGWRIAAQWLGFSLSLSVGGLQFRALFYRRSTPLLGRLTSLLSPMIVLALILTTWLRA